MGGGVGSAEEGVGTSLTWNRNGDVGAKFGCRDVQFARLYIITIAHCRDDVNGQILHPQQWFTKTIRPPSLLV